MWKRCGVGPLHGVNMIYRETDGVKVPCVGVVAFVRQNDVYFPTEIKVYQDGMIDCWGLLSLAEFEKKVVGGWIVATPPEGAKVKVPSVAHFAVADLQLHERFDLIEQVRTRIKDLNRIEKPEASSRLAGSLRKSSRWPYFRDALILSPVFTLLMSLSLTAIVGISGGNDEQVNRIISFNLLLFSVVSVAACATILCYPKAWLLTLDWKKILVSSDVGIVVFGILYILIKSARGAFAEFTTGQTLLLGALSGLIYGGVIGVIIGVIDGKATPFTRAGVTRYAVLYGLVFIAGLIRQAVDESSKGGDLASSFVFILLLGVIMFGVWWWDRRK
jgi:hypothetical protein